MKKPLRAAVVGALGIAAAGASSAADIVRHPLLGGSTFPIARAVEVPAGKTIDGPLGVHLGTVRISGTVRGDVIVLNGDLRIDDGNGAELLGDPQPVSMAIHHHHLGRTFDRR